MARSLAALVALSALCSTTAHAQITMQPTPSPPVTAEGEAWYLDREPIVVDGRVYFPTGPVLHFHPWEMVRAGWVEDVPLYIRTTEEPRSVIYVPLARGLVRPYERRRDGELAGTVGSRAPSFPVVHPAAERRDPDPRRGPSPPTGYAVSALGVVAGAATAVSRDAVAGTAGVTPPAQPLEPPVLRTARSPEGLNAMFVDHQGRRWFLAGAAHRFDGTRLQEVGDYHGFTVYADATRPDTIYVPTVDGPPGLVTPYRSRSR